MNIKTPKGIIGICGVLVVIILLTFIPEIFSNDEEEDGKEKCIFHLSSALFPGIQST